MAEGSGGQDRTEKPTPKKLSDARKKGQVARSRELNTMISLFVASLAFVMLGDFMINKLMLMFKSNFTIDRDWMFDPQKMYDAIAINTMASLELLAPFLAIMFISAFIGPIAVGGWNFSGKSLQPKFSKLNPLTGMKRVFGPNGLVELLKALVKFVLLGAVAILVILVFQNELVNLGLEPITQGLIHGSSIFFIEFFALTAALVLVAGFDVPYQLYNHHKKLKMSLQEIKKESKQTEGNPEVKGRIRALQREISQRRMLEDVPTADVIIVNPTHFAVALKYSEGQEHAPKVIAKGVDHLALKIREIGAAHKVPIFTAPPLSRALYYSTEIGQIVPEGLYVAIAKILAYVFQIKLHGNYQAEAPTDLELPKEFRNMNSKNNRFDR